MLFSSFLRSLKNILTLCFGALTTFLSSPLPLLAVPIPPQAELTSHDMVPVYSSMDKIFDAVVPLDDGRLILEAPAWLGNKKGQLFALAAEKKLNPWPNKTLNEDATTGSKESHFTALAGVTKGSEGHIWLLDSGVKQRGQAPSTLPKVFEIDPQSDQVIHQFTIPAETLAPGSILNGITVWHNQVFLPDSGTAGLIFLDTKTGLSKRYLDHHFLLTAVHPLQGQNGVVTNAKGQPVTMDVSMACAATDGKAIFMQAPTGRLIRVVTSVLLDPQISPTELQEGLTGWYITPHLGGMAMDQFGTLYWSDISTGSIIGYTAGRIPHRLITDERLQWPTTPGISKEGDLYVTASQVDRTSAFGLPETVKWPITIYKFHLPKDTYNSQH